MRVVLENVEATACFLMSRGLFSNENHTPVISHTRLGIGYEHGSTGLYRFQSGILIGVHVISYTYA
jgi:hypothetical protein